MKGAHKTQAKTQAGVGHVKEPHSGGHDVNVVNVHVTQGKGMNTTVMNEVPTT